MEFKLIDKPKQRHLEEFLLEIRRQAPGGLASLFGEDSTAFHGQGVVARAAVIAGWIDSPPLSVEGVGDLDWRDCDALASQVLDAYRQAVFVDPNS